MKRSHCFQSREIFLYSYKRQCNRQVTVYTSLLPKSVTVAIGIGICSEYGGVVALTVAGTIFSGISGNMAASLLCQLFRIRNPIARGVAIGTASHAVGTARALEMGRTEGAMSGLSIALTGLITVALVPLFVHLF